MGLAIADAVANATKLIDDGMNKIWPSPTEKASAEAITIKATSDAAVNQMAQSMSVLLAEAQSRDPWTSRARPTFLYVMYILILCSVPMGVLTVINSTMAATVAAGMRAWLAAIPDRLWDVFGFCFCGYTAGRTIEKVRRVSR